MPAKISLLIFAALLLSAPCFAGDHWADDPWGPDEAAHAAGSLICTVLVTQITAVIAQRPDTLRWTDRLAGSLSCLAIGALKEFLIDDQPSRADLTADALGVAVGIGITFAW